MNDAISKEELAKYCRAIDGTDNTVESLTFLEGIFDRYPKLAQTRLPTGDLPLRVLLKNQQRGCFALLARHGAEHDIFTACAATDADAVMRFLRQDPELVHATDEAGNTPLHWACVEGFEVLPRDDEPVVNVLLDSGANINAMNSTGESPLRHSVLHGTGQAASLLNERGAEPDLLFCTASGDLGLLDELLDQSPREIHWRGARGNCVLHFAIERNCRPEVIEYLLARGAVEDIEASDGRLTPLLQAITNQALETAEVLIRHGANVDTMQASKRFPRSAMELAVIHDRLGLIEMLLAHGANAHGYLHDEKTLLHVVKSDEAAELLIRAGLDINAIDAIGQRPLDLAIEEGRRDVALTLLRDGAPADFFAYIAIGDREKVLTMLDDEPHLISAYNQRDQRVTTCSASEEGIEVPFGSSCGTALHYAVKAGISGMVELLLERGAPVNAATKVACWTPLHDAAYYTIYNDLRDGPAIIRRLVEAGADLTATTIGGYRPLDIADYLSFLERAAEIFDLFAELGRA